MTIHSISGLHKLGLSTILSREHVSNLTKGPADLIAFRIGLPSTSAASQGMLSIVAAGKLSGSNQRAGTLGSTKFPRHQERWSRIVDWKIFSSSSPSSVSFNDGASLDTDNDGGNGFSGRGGGSGGGGRGGGDEFGGSEGSGSGDMGGGSGIFGVLLKGWDSRVNADHQFPFKVLMEQIVGVGACVMGDMATRPNFGLTQLDLVFSTLVVGSLMNFSLMYMLAPTVVGGAVATKLPGVFSKSPPGHMFEVGSYSLLERTGTFVYKGVQFALVGFTAGLAGTCVSNTLIHIRKKVDPSYVPQTATPPLLLNSTTWAIHMGISSNARYQSLNGLEFALAKSASSGVFKVSVPVLRALNNLLGGTSFVMLARLTGAQPTSPPPPPAAPEPDDGADPMEHAISTS